MKNKEFEEKGIGTQAETFQNCWKTFINKVIQSWNRPNTFADNRNLLKKYKALVVIQVTEVDQIKQYSL